MRARLHAAAVALGESVAYELKLGQLRPGDRLRFAPVSREDDPAPYSPIPRASRVIGSPVLARDESWQIPIVYRRAGDDNVLVEYGPMTLDIGLRMRVHLLSQVVANAKVARNHRYDARYSLVANPLCWRAPRA
jgi:hypothetical protein